MKRLLRLTLAWAVMVFEFVVSIPVVVCLALGLLIMLGGNAIGFGRAFRWAHDVKRGRR